MITYTPVTKNQVQQHSLYAEASYTRTEGITPHKQPNQTVKRCASFSASILPVNLLPKGKRTRLSA